MKIMGAIKPEWLLMGLGVGVLLLLMKSRRDTNGDGKPDGLARNLGYDAGRVVPDIAVGAADGMLDGLAKPFGGSYSDCERHKKEGNTLGIYWACGPSQWPIFK